MPDWARRRLARLIAAIMLACLGAGGQGQAPGEHTFGAGIYKGSHNSYARNESLADQVMRFNVWQLELDVTDYAGSLKVTHNCDPGSLARAPTLAGLLTGLGDAVRAAQFRRFTVLYVDLKGNGGDGCAYAWGSQLDRRLREAFAGALGQGEIYPSGEFAGRDGSVWPSHQDLARRGYRWGVIIDWHGEPSSAAVADDLLFLATTETLPAAEALSPNTVLLNIDGDCDASPVSSGANQHGTRFLARLYPGSCASDCGQMNGGYWSAGVAQAYNFVASDCVDEDHTFAAPVQSPDPLFVDAGAAQDCPHDSQPCEWGTGKFPFTALGPALARASSGTDVVIAGGIYELAPGALAATPLTLRAVDGAIVEIR